MINPTRAELEQALDQAESFVRGGDYTGALARVRWAREQFQLGDERPPYADPALEELRRTAEQKLPEYERLVTEWQAENARRQASYVMRELLAIQSFAHEDAPPPVREVRQRRDVVQ